MFHEKHQKINGKLLSEISKKENGRQFMPEITIFIVLSHL